MKVQITVARSSREYGNVVIEAPSVGVAEAYVDQLLAEGIGSAAYCDLLNAASWNSGEHDDDDEVIDSEPVGDEYDADAVVPADWAPTPEMRTDEHGERRAPMKVSIEWTELSRYSVNVTLPADAPTDPNALKEWLEEADPTPVRSGEARWFDLVEAQAPDWATDSLESVSEREVQDITILKDGRE
jgi:hypothetical protein